MLSRDEWIGLGSRKERSRQSIVLSHMPHQVSERSVAVAGSLSLHTREKRRTRETRASSLETTSTAVPGVVWCSQDPVAYPPIRQTSPNGAALLRPAARSHSPLTRFPPIRLRHISVDPGGPFPKITGGPIPYAMISPVVSSYCKRVRGNGYSGGPASIVPVAAS